MTRTRTKLEQAIADLPRDQFSNSWILTKADWSHPMETCDQFIAASAAVQGVKVVTAHEHLASLNRAIDAETAKL